MGDRRFGDFVGQSGIHAAPHRAIVIVDFDEFPGVGEFAGFAIASRDHNSIADMADSRHRSGVRAVGGNEFACGELDVGEEPFVTADELAFNERRIGVDLGHLGKLE